MRTSPWSPRSRPCAAAPSGWAGGSSAGSAGDRGGRPLARRGAGRARPASRSAASTCPRPSAGWRPAAWPRSSCWRRWPRPTPAASRPPTSRDARPARAGLPRRRPGRARWPRPASRRRPVRPPVVDPEERPRRVDWAPAWPPLRWVWVSEGDDAAPARGHRPSTGRSPGARLPGLGRRSPCRSTPPPSGARWRLPAGGGAGAAGPGPAVGGGRRRRRRPGRARRDHRVHARAHRVRQAGRPPPGQRLRPRRAAARVHGARLVVRDAAAAFDRDEPYAGFWATQAWSETMDAAFIATNLGIQLLGGHGFIVDHLAEKRFREARHAGPARPGAATPPPWTSAAQVLDVPDPLFDAGPGGAIVIGSTNVPGRCWTRSGTGPALHPPTSAWRPTARPSRPRSTTPST